MKIASLCWVVKNRYLLFGSFVLSLNILSVIEAAEQAWDENLRVPTLSQEEINDILSDNISQNYKHLLNINTPSDGDDLMIVDNKEYKGLDLLRESNTVQKLHLVRRYYQNLPCDFLHLVPSRGESGAKVFIYQSNNNNIIAIKSFDCRQRGLREYLRSIVAFNLSLPLHNEIKMVKIFNAIEDNIEQSVCLNLIMEGANTNHIHSFLSKNQKVTSEDSNIIKACAQYLAKFHVGMCNNENCQAEFGKYIEYAKKDYIAVRELINNNDTVPTGGSELIINARNITTTAAARNMQLSSFKKYVIAMLCIFKENYRRLVKLLESSEYFLTITHGDMHGKNLFYNNSNEGLVDNEDYKLITMIDYDTMCNTYGKFGDPAEDVGRFLASLGEWGVNKNVCDKKVKGLQNIFVQHYLGYLKSRQEKFNEGLFEGNYNFYKLRFYKAIFNNQNKSNDHKINILRFLVSELDELLGENYA